MVIADPIAARYDTLRDLAALRNVRIDAPALIKTGWIVKMHSEWNDPEPKHWDHTAKGDTAVEALDAAIIVLEGREKNKDTTHFCPTCGRPRGE